jgi:hypothetical protein
LSWISDSHILAHVRSGVPVPHTLSVTDPVHSVDISLTRLYRRAGI